MIEVIAECGKNQIDENNSYQSVSDCLERAKILAIEVKKVGADICKWQCHESDEYVKRDTSRHTWIKRCIELTPLKEFWIPLKEFHDSIDLPFLVTPMSLEAAKKINPLVERWKVASPDITDKEMLDYMLQTKKPMIISLGMATSEERQAMWKFQSEHPNVKLLHCISEYPCPLEHLNIKEVSKYDGLSDHSMSLITGAIAVALNAQIIEKHFTLNNWGKDAHMSLNPEQLKTYIENIREAEKAMIKTNLPTEEEMELRKIFRK